MRKFKRAPAPEFLLGKWELWGKEWEQRRAESSTACFHWHRVEGESVNRKLLPVLKAQVQDHCSFCDNYPICPPSYDTVEHFRPKTLFPREAYRWENLYYCCDCCQGKGDEFDEVLLQPDAEDYAFDRFFRWDYTRGTLEANELASAEDQHRARVTLKLYRLNAGHPSLRRWELRRRSLMPGEPLDDFAYRDFVGSPPP
ncbi:MAG: hypothetical protein ABSH34_20455 [Verrucomicrobiota bacterium]|jgi:uncharacterized protein (TIGR02646 family)